MRTFFAKLICRLKGHVMYRIADEPKSILAALLPMDKCKRCGYCKMVGPSAIVGIDRASYIWWRNDR